VAVIQCAKCEKSLTPEQLNTPCPDCGSRERRISALNQTKASERAEAAKELANRHYELEAGLTQIFRITDKSEAQVIPAYPIKLLEVNENTVESGVMPLHFGPAPASGIPYSSIIIEVTPNEFKKIQSNELKLPEGWEIGEELPRPSPSIAGTADRSFKVAPLRLRPEGAVTYQPRATPWE
jgi:hypothetical protein